MKRFFNKNKTNNSGFTMVEIIATIVIMGIILVIILLGYSKYIKNSRIKYDNEQTNLFIQAGKDYFNDNRGYLPTAKGQKTCVTLSTLISNKYIDKIYDSNKIEYSDNSKVCATKISTTSAKYKYTGKLLHKGETDDSGSEPGTYSKPSITFKIGNKNFGQDVVQTGEDDKKYSITMIINDNNNDISSYKYTVYKKVGDTDSVYFVKGPVDLENQEKQVDVDINLNITGTYYVQAEAYNDKNQVVVSKSGQLTLNFTKLECNNTVTISGGSSDWTNENITNTFFANELVDHYFISLKNASNNSIIQEPIRVNNTSETNGIYSYTISANPDEVKKVYYEIVPYDKNNKDNDCVIKSKTFKIDKNPPRCLINSNIKGWTNQNVIINAYCYDSDSKCTKNEETKKIDTNFNTNYTVTFSDNAGNTVDCETQHVQVDKTNPTPTLNAVTTYKSATQTLTLKCDDNYGITGYYFGTTPPNSSTIYTPITTTKNFTKDETITNTGTYYLSCKDVASNTKNSSKSYVNYTINNMYQNLSGSAYTTNNYTNSSSNTYLIAAGTTLPLTEIYTIPSGSNPDRFDGIIEGTASSNSSSPSKPTITINENKTFTTWFTRNTMNAKYKVNGGTLQATSHTEDGSTTYNWGINSDGYITRNNSVFTSSYRYGSETMDVANYNNINAMYIYRNGYTTTSGQEWICESGCPTTDQIIPHAGNTNVLCDASNNDCTAVLKVNWKRRDYTIDYNLNDGKNNSANPSSYTVDSNTITLGSPTRQDYIFDGWIEQIKNLVWNKGFVNLNTGIVETNSDYSNSYYTDMIRLKKGIKYTLSGYGSYSTSAIRWRIYNLDGSYNKNVSNTEYTPDADCYVRILFYNAPTSAQRTGTVITSNTGKSTTIPKGSTHNRVYIGSWNKDISKLNITLSETKYSYDGNAKTPTITVRDGDTVLEEGDNKDYKVQFKNNTNVGTATVTITGTGKINSVTNAKYAGTKDILFTIEGTKIDFPTCSDKTYKAEEQTLFEAHTSGGYTNSILKGTTVNSYTVDLTPSTNYQWSDLEEDATLKRTLTCKIVKSDTTTTLGNVTKTYNGNNQAASGATAKLSNGTAISGAAFTYTYYTNSECSTKTSTSDSSGATSVGGAPMNAGTYYVKATLTGTSNYNTSSSECKTYTMNKSNPVIKLGTTPTLTFGTDSELTYTYDGDGTVNCSSSDETAVTCSVNNTNKKITLHPVKATTSNITITVSSTVGTNSSAADNKTTTVTVGRKKVTFPTCSDKAYKAEEQTLFEAHTSGEYTNNALLGTNVGSYTSDLTPTSNYQWSSGENVTSKRTLTCKIVKSNTTTTLSNISNAYTGNEQPASGATAKLNSNNAVISGAAFTYTYYSGESCETALTKPPTDVGKYSVKATLTGTSNYNSSTSSCVKYTMSHYKPVIKLGTTPTLTFGTDGELTYTYDGDGTVNCSSSDETAVTCSVDNTNKKITLHPVKATTSNITITVSSTVGTNSSAADNKTTTVTVGRKKVTFPTCTAKTYSGSSQTLFEAHTSGTYTNSALTGTNASSSTNVYTVDLTPTSNYQWSSGDNVTSKRTLTCTINKYTPSIALSASSGSVNWNSEKTFTVTPTVITACKGTLTATSENTTYVTISSGGSTANATSAVTVKWKGALETSGTKINVNYTPTDTTNCNAATQKQYTSTVTVVPAASITVSLTAKSATYTGNAIAANTASASPNGGGAKSYTYYTNSSCSTKTSTSDSSGAASSGAAPKNVGNYYVKAKVEGVEHKTETAYSACTSHTITSHATTMSISPTTGTLTYGTNGTITVTTDGDGTISCSTSDGTVVGCSTDNTTKKITVTPKANTADGKKATITVKQAAGTNYSAADNKTYSVTVNRKTITCPTTEKNYVYTGSSIASGISCPTGSTAGGTQSASAVNSYAQTCTANSGYKFASTCSVNWYINNAKITFNKGTCDSISGSTTLYAKKGVASTLYSGIRNTTTGTVPTASKSGYTFAGWYTGTSGGSKIINADKTVVASVSGWTDADKKWELTENKNVNAHCTYSAKPTITTTDHNTFSYSATAASKYNVSDVDVSTKPTASSTWVTTTSKNVSSAGTYYVWAQDANGNISANSASIGMYTISRSETNGSLTTRYDSTSSSTGTAFTSNTNMLKNTDVWAKCVANSGYHVTDSSLKHGSTSIAGGSGTFKVSAKETISCSPAGNTYTVQYCQGNNGTTAGSECSSTTSSHTYDTAKNLTDYANLGFTAPKGWAFAGWSTSQTGTSVSKVSNVSLTNKASALNLTTTNGGTVKLYAVFKRTIKFNSGASCGTTSTATQYYNPYKTTGYITSVSFPVPTLIVANKGWEVIGYRYDKQALAKNYSVTTEATSLTPAYDVYDATTSTSTTLNMYGVYKRTITAYHGKAKNKSSSLTQYANCSSNTVSTVSLPAPDTSSFVANTKWAADGYRGDTTAGEAGLAAGERAPAYTVSNTLYAVYSRNLTMAYDGNNNNEGATASHTKKQYYNTNGSVSTVTFTTATNGFIRYGYNFSKWANDSTSGTQVAQGSAAAGFAPGVDSTSLTKTMYAIWSEKTHTLQINPNGGTRNGSTDTETTDPYTISNKVYITLSKPTRTGYTFTGWSNQTKVSPSKDDPSLSGDTFNDDDVYPYNNVTDASTKYYYGGSSVASTSKYDVISSGTGLGNTFNNKGNIITLGKYANSDYDSTSKARSPFGSYAFIVYNPPESKLTSGATPGFGGFYQQHTPKPNHTYLHVVGVICGNDTKGNTTYLHFNHNYLGIGGNDSAADGYGWVTQNRCMKTNESESAWKIYMYKIKYGKNDTTNNKNIGTFGHIYFSDKADNNNKNSITSGAHFSANIGYSLVFDITDPDDVTKVKDSAFGQINSSKVSKLTATWTLGVYKLTLNNQGATSAGTTFIYEKYNTGYYRDYSSGSVSGAMQGTNAKGITKPAKTGYNFYGYYTATNGGGTRILDENGKLISGTSTTQFTSNTTLYARWINGTYKISFDKQSGSGGSDYMVEKYNVAYNQWSSFEEGYEVTTSKGINKPSRSGFTFQGYYTATGGGGKQIITKDGKLSSGVTTKQFTADTTVYAYWASSVVYYKCTFTYNYVTDSTPYCRLPSDIQVFFGSWTSAAGFYPTDGCHAAVDYDTSISIGLCKKNTILNYGHGECQSSGYSGWNYYNPGGADAKCKCTDPPYYECATTTSSAIYTSTSKPSACYLGNSACSGGAKCSVSCVKQ